MAQERACKVFSDVTMKKLGKKGELGLDLTKLVMISLLVLAIIAVAAFIVLTSMRDSFEAAETLKTASVYNESITLAVATPAALTYSDATHRNAVCSIMTVLNSTSASGVYEVIPSTNYTLSKDDCRITGVSANDYWEGVDINITYTASWNDPEAYQIVANISYGSTRFFANAPVFFVLLGVIVLILLIAIVIRAVGGFEGAGFEGGGSRKSSIEI